MVAVARHPSMDKIVVSCTKCNTSVEIDTGVVLWLGLRVLESAWYFQTAHEQLGCTSKPPPPPLHLPTEIE